MIGTGACQHLIYGKSAQVPLSPGDGQVRHILAQPFPESEVKAIDHLLDSDPLIS